MSNANHALTLGHFSPGPQPVIEFAQAHNLLVIEDCAEAFDGLRYKGHPKSDVVLFSFGPIKFATAFQ
eukprot:1361985-Rhodomonas_salina.1